MNPARAAVPRAVLDTNVIYSRVLHELIGRVAREARLFDLIWSDELLAEAKRVLIETKPMSEPVAERWVSYMRDAFPDGRTDIADTVKTTDLSRLTRDPNDQHVCALALAGEAQLLITFDDGYRRGALRERAITVTTPDELLAPAFDEQPGMFLAILERQAVAWGDRARRDLLDALARAGVPVFASKARVALDA